MLDKMPDRGCAVNLVPIVVVQYFHHRVAEKKCLDSWYKKILGKYWKEAKKWVVLISSYADSKIGGGVVAA